VRYTFIKGHWQLPAYIANSAMYAPPSGYAENQSTLLAPIHNPSPGPRRLAKAPAAVHPLPWERVRIEILFTTPHLASAGW